MTTSTDPLSPVVEALGRGEVVLVVTDTVVGLAARPDRPEAIRALYELKGRPAGLALPVLCAHRDQAAALARPWTPLAEHLAERAWPGGLTLVVNADAALAAAVGSGDASVGLRVPAQPPLLALLERTGPLAATSCNRHGDPPAADLAEARLVFGTSLAALDGPRPSGLASTVVDARGEVPTLLRRGAISWDELSSP